MTWCFEDRSVKVCGVALDDVRWAGLLLVGLVKVGNFGWNILVLPSVFLALSRIASGCDVLGHQLVDGIVYESVLLLGVLLNLLFDSLG